MNKNGNNKHGRSIERNKMRTNGIPEIMKMKTFLAHPQALVYSSLNGNYFREFFGSTFTDFIKLSQQKDMPFCFFHTS